MPGEVRCWDNEQIVIGWNCNVREGAVLHTDPGSPLRVGDDANDSTSLAQTNEPIRGSRKRIPNIHD